MTAMVVVALADTAFAASEEQACSYAVTPLTVSVSGAGGTGQINVTTSAVCSWTATTGTPWLSLSPGSGVGSGTVTWVAAPNTLRSQRFGSLGIGGRSVFVSQTQGSPTTAAPGAPRQLTASISGASATFTWSPPDSGGAPTTYVLAAGSANGLSNIAQFATGSTSTTFTANNVPGGVYFVRVSAQNAVGTGPASNEVTFSVGQQPCSAASPSGLQFTVNGSLVTLHWSAPAGGAGTTSYQVEAGRSPSSSDLASVNTGSPTTTFAAHAPPGTYFVRVRAVTACGVSAPTSDAEIVVQP